MNDVQHMPQKVIWIFIFFVFALVFGGGYFMYSGWQKNTQISDYDQCVATGNLVQESNPPQCRADGQVFVQGAGIGN